MCAFNCCFCCYGIDSIPLTCQTCRLCGGPHNVVKFKIKPKNHHMHSNCFSLPPHCQWMEGYFRDPLPGCVDVHTALSAFKLDPCSLNLLFHYFTSIPTPKANIKISAFSSWSTMWTSTRWLKKYKLPATSDGANIFAWYSLSWCANLLIADLMPMIDGTNICDK